MPNRARATLNKKIDDLNADDPQVRAVIIKMFFAMREASRTFEQPSEIILAGQAVRLGVMTGRPFTTTQIAKKVQINVRTARRYLARLEEDGFVVFGKDGRWYLGENAENEAVTTRYQRWLRALMAANHELGKIP
jgi:transcription initiation factor IIE alpha subunit